MNTTATPLGYSIPAAVQASGITRTRLYELIGTGTLDARKAGRRTIITADSLRAYLNTLPKATVRAPKQRVAA